MRIVRHCSLAILGTLSLSLVACDEADTLPREDPFNELNKQLEFNRETGELVLSDNGSSLDADLSSLGDDADADPTNEAIGGMSLDGTELVVDEGAATLSVDLAPLIPPPQDLSFDPATNELGISGGGSSVQLPTPQLTFDAATRALAIAGGNTVPVPAFTRIFVVSPVGSPAENGAALLAHYDAIEASEDAPALLFIEPGRYDITPSTWVLREHIDVAGAGANVTKVASVLPGSNAVLPPIVEGADGVTMRDLTLVLRLPPADAINRLPVFLHATAITMRLERVDMFPEQPQIPTGIPRVIVDGGARVDVDGCRFFDSGIFASGENAQIIVRDSRMEALGVNLGASARIVNTQVDSVFNFTGGDAVRCFSAYTSAFTALSGCASPP